MFLHTNILRDSTGENNFWVRITWSGSKPEHLELSWTSLGLRARQNWTLQSFSIFHIYCICGSWPLHNCVVYCFLDISCVAQSNIRNMQNNTIGKNFIIFVFKRESRYETSFTLFVYYTILLIYTGIILPWLCLKKQTTFAKYCYICCLQKYYAT